MATNFLKTRFPEFLREISGTETVSYIALDPSSADALTGDVDDSVAYNATPIKIGARVVYNPTRAMRNLVGKDVEFNAVLRLSREDVSNKGIALKFGDAFILPNDSQKVYVKRIVEGKQSGTDFIEYLVFVSATQHGRN